MKWVLLLIVLYLACYVAFRAMNSEVWEADGQSYVIYPENGRFIYLLWRPLAYADAMLTGMGSHIGPHLEATE